MKTKIIYSEIVQEPQFYLDKKGEFLPEATAFLMTGKHLDYLYKLFHTKTITYFFKTFYAGGGLGENGYRYKKAFLENLPIPKFINSELQQQIVSAEENENIENLVYSLYQLSNKEFEYMEDRAN